MTRYFLGVDGGGTKTEAGIVDGTGQLLGTGQAGPSNYDDVGADTAQANISLAVEAAKKNVDSPGAQFDAAFLGMAGLPSAKDRAIIRNIAQNLRLSSPETTGVDSDVRIALAAGLGGRPGMVQIAGTGSHTFGMNAAGESWRAGGWGHLLSDEGSGYWLGIQAMKAAVRATDGRINDTSLVERVQTHLGLDHMNEIMHRIYVGGLSRADVAAMAPLVMDAAQDGDKVARALIRRGAEELAMCVMAVAERLGFADGPSELATVGGLFEAGDVFAEPFRSAVVARLPRCHVIPAELPPVLGACMLAMRMVNLDTDGAIIESLRRSVE
ncbi:MAG: N-acetylglucosamine kinase [Anaerolineae bacterium]